MMLRSSLRVRMMLLFTALSGALLVGTCLAFYAILARILVVQFDQRLLGAVQPVIADLTPESEEDIRALNTPADDDITKLNVPGEYFELIARSGQILQQSKNLAGPPLDMGPLPTRVSEPLYRSLHDRSRGAMRSILIPVQRGPYHCVLLLAMPSAQIDQTLADFRRIIALLLPAALLLAAAISVWYVSRSLRPIAELTRHAEERTQQTLDGSVSQLWMPLTVTNPGDELGRLAATFNHLFARIDSAVCQLRQFVTDASHELRTPLTVLQGETELILSAPREAPDYRKSLECMDGELKKLSRIVKNLFTLSMADAGQLSLTSEPLYLNEIIEQSCAVAVPLARTKDICIERQLQQEVPYCGDEAVLRQLFLIFLENAVKYSPPGTRIRVDLTLCGRHAHVRFMDEGIGIAPSDLPHIFERFYRVPGSVPAEGGGLGLSIAQALVRKLGGSIECSSATGQGSTFTVRLPLRAFAHTAAPA